VLCVDEKPSIQALERAQGYPSGLQHSNRDIISSKSVLFSIRFCNRIDVSQPVLPQFDG
jgi:hypothetical protein